MDLTAIGQRVLSQLDPRLVAAAERALRRIPFVRDRLHAELEGMLGKLEPSLKPYRGRLPDHARLPDAPRPREELAREVEAMAREETPRWRDGLVSGAVYHGDPEHAAFLAQVQTAEAHADPHHPGLWPSVAKMEAEVVAMTASLLGAEEDGATSEEDARVCGAVTSGGAESILLAMKVYRDRARAGGNDAPEIVAPSTAHVAFDKAAQLLGQRLVRVPVGPEGVADVAGMRRAMGRRTAVVVASAPAFPHGLVDPVPALAELARERKVGLHVDAGLGAFVLPFARDLGYPVPAFDFRLPGVTSMSADTHRYGYAPKGTSVVLYRGHALRALQYFVATEWPGGLYFSPTLAGSRPGALSAAAWAAMLSLGRAGYRDAARRILETAARMKHAIRSIPELRLVRDPLFVLAFTSDAVDVYRVLDAMTARGWRLNGLQRPPAVRLAVTLRHCQPGVAERFAADLQASVAEVKAKPAENGGLAPVYGLAASLPFRGVIADLLRAYVDRLYRV